MDDNGQSLECLTGPPGVFFLAGAVIILIIFFVAVTRYRSTHRGIVPFESEGGRIEIRPGTIRSLIAKTAEQTDGVEEARCKIKQGRGLTVHLNIVARGPVRLQEMDAEIKRRVRSALKIQIGMEDIDSINIRVTRVLGEVNLPEDEFADEPAPEDSSGSERGGPGTDRLT